MLLALDRHGRNPREADQGHRRQAPAALSRRRHLDRLVGDVHHHDRRPHRIPVSGLRLLLLLDGPRGLSRRPASTGPGWVWPLVAAVLTVAAWGLTLMARLANAAREQSRSPACCWSSASSPRSRRRAALLAGPWTTGLDPTSHAYPAIVWALAVWIALHLAVGVIMQAYCLARSWFGRMTPTLRRRPLERHALLALHRRSARWSRPRSIGGFPLVS